MAQMDMHKCGLERELLNRGIGHIHAAHLQIEALPGEQILIRPGNETTIEPAELRVKGGILDIGGQGGDGGVA